MSWCGGTAAHCVVGLTLKVGPDSGVVADHQSVQDVGGGVGGNLSQVLWRKLAVKGRKKNLSE